MPDAPFQTAPLLEADFYDGAFGPSILLVLTTQESVAWLREVFEDLADAPIDAVVNLIGLPQVQAGAALAGLVLRRVVSPPDKHLALAARGAFSWSCAADEWKTMSLMLEPFPQQQGHQYLTAEGTDDAVIEVSYGEHHRRLTH